MVTLERFDPNKASDSDLLGVHEVYVSAEAEGLPDDPPMPLEQRMAKWRSTLPSHVRLSRWLARDNGRVVGTAHATRWPEEDPHNGVLWEAVLPTHRRRGIGRAMALAALDELETAGVKSVITDVNDGAGIESFLERVGMKEALGEKRSRLQVADIDWDLMDLWVSRATERADGYTTKFLEVPLPEEDLERWSRIHTVMNTAPFEDLEIEERPMTPEKWRESERAFLERGDRVIACVAVHEETGEFAGFTDIVIQRYQRDLALQEDTAVDPAHRNKGLGRLVKASLIKRLAEEHPEVVRIDTFNAGSNDAMLNINIEMGYVPILAINAWQGDIPALRSGLES